MSVHTVTFDATGPRSVAFFVLNKVSPNRQLCTALPHTSADKVVFFFLLNSRPKFITIIGRALPCAQPPILRRSVQVRLLPSLDNGPLRTLHTGESALIRHSCCCAVPSNSSVYSCRKCVIIRFKNKQLEARDNDCVIIMQ